MVHLFLRLDFVPVGKALEAAILVIIGEGQVQVSGVKLLVDLLVEDRRDALVHGHGCLFLLALWGGVRMLSRKIYPNGRIHTRAAVPLNSNTSWPPGSFAVALACMAALRIRRAPASCRHMPTH